MTRYRASPRRRGFMGEAVHSVRKALYSADHFFRANGARMKQFAMMAAPALAAMGPTGKIAGAAVATMGQGADAYASLRGQMGD